MKKLLLIALSTFSLSALADKNAFYVGGNVGFWNYEELSSNLASVEAPSPGTEFNMAALELMGGYYFLDNIAVEGRFGVSIEADTETYYAASQRHNKIMDYYASLYVRPELANDVAKLYGLLGLSAIGVTSKVPAGTGVSETDDTDAGLSFGFGVGFFYNDETVINIEWKKLLTSDDRDVAGLTIGFDMTL